MLMLSQPSVRKSSVRTVRNNHHHLMISIIITIIIIPPSHLGTYMISVYNGMDLVVAVY
jgi:hypothetical protein